MRSPYVYMEYPKCLYRDAETCTVQSEEAEMEAANDGWLTAGQFHGTEPKPVIVLPAQQADPVVEPEPEDEPNKKPSKKGK